MLKGKVCALIHNSETVCVEQRVGRNDQLSQCRRVIHRVQKASGWSLCCSAHLEMFEKGEK